MTRVACSRRALERGGIITGVTGRSRFILKTLSIFQQANLSPSINSTIINSLSLQTLLSLNLLVTCTYDFRNKRYIGTSEH